ncbi:CPBP family intramembrane metalloprotease [Candidatus Aminicenantes bacterium AC-334-K16]|jgi:hypothetical protein|nr:CPBP family intramembrane metalloprotease [Candidatus Aminicenantes bacterium AC-334-K16]
MVRKQAPSYLLWFLLSLAALLFLTLFWLAQEDKIDFWWSMSFNLSFLLALSFFTDRTAFLHLQKEIKEKSLSPIVAGLLAAGILFGFFWAGKTIASHLFSSAPEAIKAIYSFKEGASSWRIALLMLLVIGPGEEIFWRGTIQQLLAERYSPRAGFLLTTLIYAAVHLTTGNPLLIAAALVAGLFWGGLYLWRGSILTIVVSHTVWDILVFIVFPLSN